MGKFFTVFMLTPWDSLNSNSLTEVRLLSLKNIIKTFPVIEPEFFDDLLSNLYKFKHYSWIECIRRIIGPNGEDYDITPWNFLWVMDNERRIFQILFQKAKKEIKDSQATMVAIAPPELGELFKQHKESAILRTLSLLNDPKKMKFVMILAPKGKSLTEEQQLLHINKNYLDKFKINKNLKQMPNIKGQWFPEYSPRCPNCNKLITEIRGFNVGLLKFRCPYCGYQKR
ncbi:hypothetical protein LCGC14_0601660 [marine sediment metagenome]|uniref:Uncharacterized protein n=1 Tax=marine sediment metagenome TaxID=412755 RepID=A0A0F9RUF4_9ZZZZ|nr:MAG: hypothetical protein Lokiarch_20730 [Candidatus Lokiarchaeum sp. GC14_75]